MLGLELRHTCLRFFAPGNGFHAGDKPALFDDQFVVDGLRKGKRHGVIVPDVLKWVWVAEYPLAS